MSETCWPGGVPEIMPAEDRAEIEELFARYAWDVGGFGRSVPRARSGAPGRGHVTDAQVVCEAHPFGEAFEIAPHHIRRELLAAFVEP